MRARVSEICGQQAGFLIKSFLSNRFYQIIFIKSYRVLLFNNLELHLGCVSREKVLFSACSAPIPKQNQEFSPQTRCVIFPLFFLFLLWNCGVKQMRSKIINKQTFCVEMGGFLLQAHQVRFLHKIQGTGVDFNANTGPGTTSDSRFLLSRSLTIRQECAGD